MNNLREILISLAWRALIASPLFYVCFSGRAGALSPLFGVAGAIIVFSSLLARLIAEPSGRLFWPGEHFDRPQPVYGIPQSKRKKGLYEEAMAGFEKIAKDYPEEVQPYIEMIDIAILDLKDPERANRIYQNGIGILAKEKDKETLAIMYSAIRSRLNARPGS
jgi:hypothetical protein